MTAPSAPLLRAVGLTRRYGDFLALDGIDVALSRGEAVALTGPNGAGKTTLLSILAGVTRPTDGTVEARNGRPGWVPQGPSLYGRLTTAENLRLFAALEGDADPDGLTADLIARADLTGFADQPAHTLSTGTLQRLNLCVALAGRPGALLLDEPTASLSPDQRHRFWDWLAELRADAGLAVLFSTQSVDEAVRRADRLLVLARGRVAFAGGPEELASGAASDPAQAEAAFLRLVSDDGP